MAYYTPAYWYNWRGEYRNSQAQLIYDFFINDSSAIFLAGDQVSGSMVSKFNAPVLTSIPDNPNSLQLFLYPNPATDAIEFTIHLHNTSDANYLIMDAMGRRIAGGTIKNGATNKIDIQTFPASLYFLIISDETGRQLTSQKFIKN